MNSSGSRHKEAGTADPPHPAAPARYAKEFEEYTRAMLNILEDSAAEKERMEETQRAVLNILDDFAREKAGAEENQRAMLNILDDFTREKAGAEENQRAMLNILDDFDVERTKSDAANRELREAFDSLRRAKGAADAANRELEAFSYSVSHDLRAPLRHIKGFVELLKDSAGPSLDKNSLEHLDIISGAAQKMGNLVDDLLAFSRMGRAEMRRSRIELEKLVNDVIKEIKSEEGVVNVRWRIAALPVVYGDPAMIKLVLVNLISNAIKFTRRTATPTIEVGSLTSDEDDSVIFVKDNGAGFDMQFADKLFGVFQRLHKADEFEGTGIGLANVRRIISRHGGRTWAEGAVGKGATFYFSLPQFMPEKT